MTEKEMLVSAFQLGNLVTSLNESTTDKSIDAQFATERAQALEAVKYRGIAPANVNDMLDNIEAKLRGEFDEVVREGAARALELRKELDAALDEAEQAAAVLKPAAYHDVSARLQARTAAVLERQEFRLEMTRGTLETLGRRYTQLTDADAPELVAFIEHEAAEGFPTLQLRALAGVDQVKVLAQLQAKIAERRVARTPLYVKELRAKLQTVMPDSRRVLLRTWTTKKGSPAMSRFTRKATPASRRNEMSLA